MGNRFALYAALLASVGDPLRTEPPAVPLTVGHTRRVGGRSDGKRSRKPKRWKAIKRKR